MRTRFLKQIVLAASTGLLFLFSCRANAQSDSLELPPKTIVGADSVAVKNTATLKTHNIRRATLLSVAIPGAGQVYNRKWWKAPIVYAGLGTAFYFANLNQSEYKKLSNAFDQRQDPNNTEPDAYTGRFNDRQLVANMRTYQSNRDLSIVFLVLMYGLNIIDANVDAHLFEFDISDDLSFKLEPKAWHNTEATTAGLSLTLKF